MVENDFEGDNVDSEQVESCDYVALKGTFFTPKNGDIAGAFCIVYLGATGKVIDKFFHVSRVSTRPEVSPQSNWESFTSEMGKIGAYDKSLSDKVSEVVLSSTDSNLRIYLFNNIEDAEGTTAEIRKALEKSLHYFIEVEATPELFDHSRAESGGVLRRETHNDQSAASDVPLEGVTLGKMALLCQPQIDPISGCPISALRPGMMVYVNIKESNDIAKKIVDILRAQNAEAIFPVESVNQLESGQVAVTLKINDEVSGVMKISNDLMLKTERAFEKDKSTQFLLNKVFLIQLAALGGVLVFIGLLVHFIRELI